MAFSIPSGKQTWFADLLGELSLHGEFGYGQLPPLIIVDGFQRRSEMIVSKCWGI